MLVVAFSACANHAAAAEIVENEEDLRSFLQQFRTALLREAFKRPPPSPELLAEARASIAAQLLLEPANTSAGEGGFFAHRMGFHLVWQGMLRARVRQLWGDPTVIVPPRFDEELDVDVPEQWYWVGEYPASLCFDDEGRVTLHPHQTIDWRARKRYLDEVIFMPLRKAHEARIAGEGKPLRP